MRAIERTIYLNILASFSISLLMLVGLRETGLCSSASSACFIPPIETLGVVWAIILLPALAAIRLVRLEHERQAGGPETDLNVRPRAASAEAGYAARSPMRPARKSSTA